MIYEDWVKHRRSAEQIIESLVLQAEEAMVGDSSLINAAKSAVVAQFSALPFSQRVWEVFFVNTGTLAGVKRIDKRPYATHPTRMALSCYWLANHQLAEDSAVPALLHDYLEESGGISRASIAALNARLPSEPLAIPAAVLLSEPDISYEILGSSDEESKLKRVAYAIQARDALQKGFPVAFANASIVDKLDNLHDLGYLDKESVPEKRSRKIAQRIAFFQLTLQLIGPQASPKFQRMLADAIKFRTQEFNLETLLCEELDALKNIQKRCETTIQNMIGLYHKSIGLH